ncbi:hypothetical protein FA13DRAFT_121073 [Coprinellus micaceus]|uniref:Uncharacterized protein n=1 Tax=Coprinellus micaceus TaxID=71717 RepID=A0A4Y7TID5_COPMI|nr:hypothetical protein FA13DRAFT_121073 [Coprinellus micaceus]
MLRNRKVYAQVVSGNNQQSYLTHRFIPLSPGPPRTKRTRQTHKQSTPGSARGILPSLILILSPTHAPPPLLRLLEPFQWDIIQLLILDPKLSPIRPKVPAVPHDADVEWVVRLTRFSESIDGFALGEPIEPKEVKDKVASTVPMRMWPTCHAPSIPSNRTRVLTIHPRHCLATLLLMPRAHLRRQTRANAAAHESIPSEVGYFERRHLPSYLPVLRSEEDAGPGELEGGPEGDRDKEGVVGGHVAEVAGEGA